jgi:hypothetical protein
MRYAIVLALVACGTDEPVLCKDGNPACDQRCATAAAEGPGSEAAGVPIGGTCEGVAIDGSGMHCPQRVDFDGNIGCCVDGGWFDCTEGE